MVAGAPVLDNVAQFNGLAGNDSRIRPLVTRTAPSDVVHADNFPMRRDECDAVPDADEIRGENDSEPDNRHVTWPGAAPRYTCVLAVAESVVPPSNATRMIVAVANTIGTIGLRRMTTLSRSTVALQPVTVSPGHSHLSLWGRRGNHHN